MSHSMSTVATLFAGPGSAVNVSGSVSVCISLSPWNASTQQVLTRDDLQENVGFRFVLDRMVRTLSTTGIHDSGLTSGLLFVPSLEAQDSCNVLASEFIPQNVTRHEDIFAFGYPAIGIAPWLSAACTQSFLAASRRAESKALLFFETFNNESGIPPPASDVLWDLNDGEQWKEDNQFPVYAIPGPAAGTLMRELAWFSDGKTDRSQNGSYPSIQKRDSSIRLFTMIANGEPSRRSGSILARSLNVFATETPKDSWPLWVVAGIVLAGIIALGLSIWCTWSAISRRLIGQILTQRAQPAQRQQRQQGDIESIPMNRRDRRNRRTPTGVSDIRNVVPREVVGQFPHYIYAGPGSPSAVSLVKDDIETHVAEIDLNIQSLEPPIEETDVETPQHIQHTEDSQDIHGAQEVQESNRVVGIRRPAPAVINPSGVIVASANPYRMSYTQTECVICHDTFEIGFSSIRELPCGHIFDLACIDEWLLERSVRCPLCQTSVVSWGSIQAAATRGA